MMFKKIIGILVLLSFILLKNASPFVFSDLHAIPVDINADQESSDSTEDEKGDKQFKILADEFIHNAIVHLENSSTSRKLSYANIKFKITSYKSRLYQPPELFSDLL